MGLFDAIKACFFRTVLKNGPWIKAFLLVAKQQTPDFLFFLKALYFEDYLL